MEQATQVADSPTTLGKIANRDKAEYLFNSGQSKYFLNPKAFILLILKLFFENNFIPRNKQLNISF